jgi:L-serine kinase (ADP)
MKTKGQKSKKGEIAFFNIEELREHEEIRPDYLEALKNEILSDGILKMPICIDKNTCIILDGHHRLQALKRLGCKKIPCVLVDYQSKDISVIPWREGEKITKETIIDMALSGRKMSSKTSKHMIIVDGEWTHISAIEMTIDVPLEKLK